MAVYTDITETELGAFLTEYNLGTLRSYRGIAEGSENSNFVLHTSEGEFILTLYEKRVEAADLPFFLGLMQHLALKGISCPLPVERRDGGLIGKLFGDTRPPSRSTRSVPRVGRSEGIAPQHPIPVQQPQRGGGGFLAGAAQTALGVTGGVLLGNALAGMLGGGEAEAGAEEPQADDAGVDDGGGFDDMEF